MTPDTKHPIITLTTTVDTKQQSVSSVLINTLKWHTTQHAKDVQGEIIISPKNFAALRDEGTVMRQTPRGLRMLTVNERAAVAPAVGGEIFTDGKNWKIRVHEDCSDNRIMAHNLSTDEVVVFDNIEADGVNL